MTNFEFQKAQYDRLENFGLWAKALYQKKMMHRAYRHFNPGE